MGMLSSLMSGAAGGATLSILIRAVDQYSAELSKAQTSVGKFGVFSKVAMIGVATAIAAVTAQCVKLAMQQQKLDRQTETVLRGMGIEWNKVGDSAKEAFRKMSMASGFMADDIQAAFTQSILVTKDFAKSTELLQTAMVVASYKGMTLSDTTYLLTKAYMGQSRGLLQLNMGFTTYNDVVAWASQNTKILSEYASSLEGQTNILRSNLQELGQEIGGRLIPILNAFVGSLNMTIMLMEDVNSQMGVSILTAEDWGKAWRGAMFFSIANIINFSKASKEAQDATITWLETGVVPLTWGAEELTKTLQTQNIELENSAIYYSMATDAELGNVEATAAAIVAKEEWTKKVREAVDAIKLEKGMIDETTESINENTKALQVNYGQLVGRFGAYAKEHGYGIVGYSEKGSPAYGAVPHTSNYATPGMSSYQHGGIVTHPEIAMVGEGGPELITPLSQAGGFGEVNIVIYANSANANEVAEILGRKLNSIVSIGR